MCIQGTHVIILFGINIHVLALFQGEFNTIFKAMNYILTLSDGSGGSRILKRGSSRSFWENSYFPWDS